jgi:gluconolactonase
MFAAPPEVEAEVFTVMPDEFKRPGQPAEWKFGKDPQMHSFLEGPCIERDGSLLVSDIPFGRVFRISPDGGWTQVCEYEGEPNGLAIHKDGTVRMADHKHGLMKLDPRTGEVTDELTRLRRERFRGLNDCKYDALGNLYFNDQGQSGMQDQTGRIYRMNPDGRVDLLIDTIPSPNAMALSPSGKLLYVAVTRANQVWRLPLHADGTTTKVSVFIQLSGGTTGPDGLAMDVEGSLAVTHAGFGTVWVFSAIGEPILRIRCPSGLDVTAACYGGPDNKTLFITDSGTATILKVNMKVPGATLFSHL